MIDVWLVNVCKFYGNVYIFKNVNLDIKDGEFVVFVGLFGCGKLIFFCMIVGLDEIILGDLFIGDKKMNDVLFVNCNIGMVF